MDHSKTDQGGKSHLVMLKKLSQQVRKSLSLMRKKIKMRFDRQKEKKDMSDKFHEEPVGKTRTIDRLGGELMEDTADVSQVFNEASTEGKFNKMSAMGISVKNEKFAGDTHGNEIESAGDVPEEGGPALHSPHLDKGGGEDGVLDTALYMEPLGGDVRADAVDPDAKELALSMDNIKTHDDEVGGEVSHILTSCDEGPPGGGDLIDHQWGGHALHSPPRYQGGGGALRGPLLDGGDDQHSVPEAVGGIARHAHLLDRGGGAPDEVRQVPPVEGVGAAAQHSAGWGGLALHGHPPDQGGGEALRGPT